MPSGVFQAILRRARGIRDFGLQDIHEGGHRSFPKEARDLNGSNPLVWPGTRDEIRVDEEVPDRRLQGCRGDELEGMQ